MQVDSNTVCCHYMVGISIPVASRKHQRVSYFEHCFRDSSLRGCFHLALKCVSSPCESLIRIQSNPLYLESKVTKLLYRNKTNKKMLKSGDTN